MKKEIKKVAILGTGVMGSQIAAHFANGGIPALAYDISQEVAQKNVSLLLKLKPSPYFHKKNAQLVTPCNYDEHLALLQDVDWVIEAVIERLDIKQKLYENILPHLKAGAIISSNTSGLSLKEMSDTMPGQLKEHFLVTHFFNPPRYMHLLEIVQGEDTLPEVLQTVIEFSENVLGKGIVYAKDTPNFVANRIGVFGMMKTLELAREMNLSVEEVDKLTGPVIGRPKSATFRTADVVGLDTLALVSKTTLEKCPDDEANAVFRIPDYLQKMIENGWVGQKARQGFYQKVGQEIHSLNIETFEYHPVKKVVLEGLQLAKSQPAAAGKIEALAYSPDAAGKFVWELLASTLIYSANRIPEITDDIINIDNGLKWGFGWELGPFEIWDALGLERSVARMKKEGKQFPEWIDAMLSSGIKSFFSAQEGKKRYFDIHYGEVRDAKENPRVIRLDLVKAKRGVVRHTRGASLVDLGDGVLCAEFHSPYQPVLNPLDPTMFDLLQEALELIPAGGYKGLVIANQAANFSAGANLQLILSLAREQKWDDIDALSKRFQQIGQQLKYAPFPVVSAPFNMTLGGGLEVAMAADCMTASAELYAGLVEVGVGLIPGGGGTLRVLTNLVRSLAKFRSGPFPPVQKAFEAIGYAKVSSSAVEAAKLGHLTKTDKVVMNADHLVFEAKQKLLDLAEDYAPPEPFDKLFLPGEGGQIAIEVNLDNLVKQGVISEHDAVIGKHLARVLTGSKHATTAAPVDEQTILNLEREAFVSLCKESKTQERIVHMLKTGKPLRN